MMSRIKELGINIFLVIISLIVTTIVVETILRFTPFNELIKHNLYSITVKNIQYYLKPDIITSWDISDNFPPINFEFSDYSHKIWSNELGCFDTPYQGEKKLILLTGDSFTWGYTPFEYKWGTIMEKLIGERILKCGVAGYGTKQERFKIEKIINMIGNKPSLIVIGYMYDALDDYLFPKATVINGYLVEKVVIKDVITGEKVIHSDDELNEKIANFQKHGSFFIFFNLKNWLAKKSIIYCILKDTKILRMIGVKLGFAYYEMPKIGMFALPEKSLWIKDAWKEHLNNLREIKKLSDKLDSKLLIVLIPAREQVYEFLRPEDTGDWQNTNKRLKTILKNEKIDFLDLSTFFKEFANHVPRKLLDPQNDLYWRYDGHWNIKGNQLAALLVSNYILENNLVNTQDIGIKLLKIEEDRRKLKKML